MTVEKKLSVLSKIGKVLNENNIVWAVGGSLLLYFKGKVAVFQDIDIMVIEDNVKELKEILQQYGDLTLPIKEKNMIALYKQKVSPNIF